MADGKIDDLLDELTEAKPGTGGRSKSAKSSNRHAVPVVVGFVGGLLVAVLAGVSFWLGTRNADDSTVADGSGQDRVASAPDTAPASPAGQQGAGSDEDAADGATPTSVVTTIATSSAQDTTLGTLPPIEATDDNPSGAIRYSVFADGKFYLRGYISSEEAAARTVELVANAVGPENVVNEYIINPAAPLQIEAPVYVKDSILFDVDSAVLNDEFKPLLDGAPAFLAGDPNITIRVVARTDTSGPADYNLDLSRRRANAVIDYYLSIGVDPSRVTADPRGEEGLEETDDPEELARQRRVEFVVEGMFEG